MGKVKRAVGDALTIAGALMVFGGLCVLAYQAVFWLKYGFWTPVELRALWTALGMPEPEFAWHGVQRIALAVIGAPLSLSLVLAGFGALLYGGTWPDGSSRRAPAGR